MNFATVHRQVQALDDWLSSDGRDESMYFEEWCRYFFLDHAGLWNVSILTTMFRFWNQIIGPLLDILLPKEILEIGSGTGRTAEKLAQYSRTAGAKLTIIDYFPRFEIAAFRRTWSDVLTFHALQSIVALPQCTAPDFVVIDGDHNWFTVFHELKAIEALAHTSGNFPVVLLHHTAWPYARRDAYTLPGMVPEEFRQQYSEGGLMPGAECLMPNEGFNERIFHAVKSGGPRNGVLTAIEDFLAQTTQKLLVTKVDGFHGLMIIAPQDLLFQKKELREFLESFHLSSNAGAYVVTLEDERVQAVLAAKELKLRVRACQSEGVPYRQTLSRLSEIVLRREKTLSWRITAPLRRAGMILLRFRQTRGLCAVAKNVWSTLGEPFPDFVRWIRHQMLGALIPVMGPAKQANAVQNMYGGTVPVSVIVTARNNGAFLRECLESILAQSVKPLEIIYCDDGSDDNSLTIARSLSGIRVLPLTHRGVIAARNAAVAESTGDLLLHIDGDDSIPPEFLAQQLKALAENTGAAFAYGRSKIFGLETGSTFHPWDIQRLWTRNFINTSSLIRRSAFEAAGGWRDVTGTLWDWDLWLRISRIGPGVASDAVLNYRRHPSNWSQVQHQFGSEDIGLLFGRVRRAVARVSVCAIFSGRLPELIEPWVDALATSIRASASAVASPELVIFDHSDEGMEARITQALEKHTGVFRSVIIVPYSVRYTFSSEMERRHKVSAFLATAYNRMLQMADGDIVWFVEDDIIVPDCAYEILLKDLTDGEVPAAAVSGLYRARHLDQLVAHHIHGDVVVPVKDQHLMPLEIDLGGTGCMMALRPFVTHPFSSHWRGRSPAHDWAWCDEIRKDGHRIILDPRVRCRHYQTLTEYV